MKNLTLSLLMFLNFSSVFAQDDITDKETSKLSKLADIICASYVGDALLIVDKSTKAIKEHLVKYENIQNPTPKQMIEFLNKNKHYMVCGEEAKNYMKVAFEHGIAYDKLFNEFFLKELVIDRENYIDINAISYSGSNGTPETVLDCMIRICNSGQISEAKRFEVERLIGIFTKSLGAKKYSELSEAEKQEFLNIEWEE